MNISLIRLVMFYLVAFCPDACLDAREMVILDVLIQCR